MSFTSSYIVRAIDRFSAPTQRMVQAARNFTGRMNRVGRSVAAAGRHMRDFGQGMLTKVTLPIMAVGGLALRAAAKIETMETAFVSMVGSAEKARALMGDLKDFSTATPFQLEDIGGATKQLLAAGVAMQGVRNELRIIGDISSGANKPLNEMAQIYSKVKNKNKAYTEELLQLSDAGIPILDLLSKKFGRTKDQIFEMASDGKISFDMLRGALVTMTSKGGIFFDQMGVQSRTLAGRWSTLKDKFFLFSAAIGDIIERSLGVKVSIASIGDAIGEWTEKIQRFAEANPKLTKFLIIAAGGAAVIGPLAMAIGFLAIAVGALLSPIGLTIAAITAVTSAFTYFYATNETFRKFMNGIGEFFLWIGGLLYDFFVPRIKNAFDLIVSVASGVIEYLKGAAEGIRTILEWMGVMDEKEDKMLNKDRTVKVKYSADTDGLPGGLSAGVPVVSAHGGVGQASKVDGTIRVEAMPGTRIRSVETRSHGGADIGMSMAGGM